MIKVFQAYKFSILILLGIFVGSIVGLVMGEKAQVLQPIANLFLNLLFTIVVPIIFTSLVAAITSMGDLQRLGKTLGWMMGIFVITGVLASVYMIFVLMVFDPAQGYTMQSKEVVQEFTKNTDFLAMFTVSDYPLLWSRNNLLALMVFTIIFSICLIQVGEKAKPIIAMFSVLSDTFIKFVNIIMYLAPVGLGAFFASLVGQFGQDILGPLSRALIIYFVASIVFYFISNTIFAFIGGGNEGIKRFWKEIIPPSLTSLGTCSSAATIPTNLIAAKNIGIPEDIANLTIPMGANLHKDGACLISILKIMFMCSIYNINFFTPTHIALAIFIAVLAAIVMGAIPGGGYVAEIFIISMFGFPVEAIPLMVLIGTITDAPATMINATGDTGVAMILSRIMDGKDWIKNKIIKA